MFFVLIFLKPREMTNNNLFNTPENYTADKPSDAMPI